MRSAVERVTSSGTGNGRGLGARAGLILFLLGSIVVLSAVVRLAGMGEALSSGVLPEDAGDAAYVQHPFIAALHLVPGVTFMLLGPIQFMPGVRRRWPVVHRWSGRVFVFSGVLVAVTAMVVSAVFPPVGGLFKSSAVHLFSIAQIVTLGVALRAALRRNIPRHRAWMIRAFAIGLGVATMRLYFIPVFLLFGVPDDFNIGLGMWVGFGVNVAVAELILLRERMQVRARSSGA